MFPLTGRLYEHEQTQNSGNGSKRAQRICSNGHVPHGKHEIDSQIIGRTVRTGSPDRHG